MNPLLIDEVLSEIQKIQQNISIRELRHERRSFEYPLIYCHFSCKLIWT